MSETPYSRRQFFRHSLTGVGSAWLAANWPAILSAQEHARHAAQSKAFAKFEFFTPEQAREVEALAAQIIPSDDTPGAREAGVIHFIDRALSTFDTDKQKPYADGLGQLQAKLQELFPGAPRFSRATAEQRMTVLEAIEKTEFFGLVRTHTVMGFFCLPGRGGNRGGVGWKLIGMEDAHVYSPPFGYYDRDYPGWETGKPSSEKK